jgi:hypothetical protein
VNKIKSLTLLFYSKIYFIKKKSQIRKKYKTQTILVKFLKYKQTETEKVGLAGILTSVVLVTGIVSGLQLSSFYILLVLFI